MRTYHFSPTARSAPRLAPVLALLLGALCAAPLAGCAEPTHEVPHDPGDPAARAREAEAALRALGEGAFTVEQFQPGAEVRFTYLDDYTYPTRMVALNFKARAKLSADIDVPSAPEIVARRGKPDLSLPALERSINLLAVFGEGELYLGETKTVEASALFDDFDPGYRFRLFDKPRPASP
ncbi:MAG: hypothetical protein U0359_06375 [Byssovorax sp.]